jgi:two-component system sensor histidine kinase KdpD
MSGTPSAAEERLARIAEAQALLARVSHRLGPSLELETTVKAVLAAMRELVDFRGGSVCLVERGAVRIAAADPPVSAEVLDVRLPVGTGIGGRVVATGETIYVPDLDADDRVDPEVRRTGSNAGMVSFLAVPLVCLGRPIGLLQVDSADRDAFDAIDIMLLEGLAAQTATAIESARQTSEREHVEALKHGFINLVSHELRTPLTIATGMVHTYRNQHPDVEDEDGLLDRAGAALARLARLIEELIVMSELGAGAVRVSADSVRMRALVDDVVRASADPSAVTVRCDGAETWTTDARLVRIMLGALLENAILYAGAAEIVVADGAIEVRDEGPGLPDDVLDHRGETFTRSVRNPTTVSGLGLGLSMVAAMVGELDGELTVDSRPGEGTTVRVRLSGG